MKVFSCNNSEPELNILSYHEAIENEGIYEYVKFPNSYIIVLNHSDENTVLWYSPKNNILSHEEIDTYCTFIKTNLKLHMCLKP